VKPACCRLAASPVHARGGGQQRKRTLADLASYALTRSC